MFEKWKESHVAGSKSRILRTLESIFPQTTLDYCTKSFLSKNIYVMYWNSHLMRRRNCFCGTVDRRKALALFPAATIVRDPQKLRFRNEEEEELFLWYGRPT